MTFRLETDRLVLRSWTEADAEPLAELHADPEVMAELGGVMSREKSDGRLAWYVECYETHGFTRWVVEVDGRFAGVTGVAWNLPDHETMGPHVDIGWKYQRWAWGNGYATEAARAALADAHARPGLGPIYAYTSPGNAGSQAVMERLGMTRRPELDFVERNPDEPEWTGLVWVSEPSG